MKTVRQPRETWERNVEEDMKLLQPSRNELGKRAQKRDGCLGIACAWLTVTHCQVRVRAIDVNEEATTNVTVVRCV